MNKFVAGAGIALALTLAGSAASAATMVYDLDISDPAAGLVSGVLGTVTATEVGSNLSIAVALDPKKAEFRYSPDKQHIDFVMQLNNTSYLLSNITSPFFKQSGGGTETPFGSWNYALNCNKGSKGHACQPGWTPTANPTALSFLINHASLADLQGNHTYGGKKVWFAADVVTSNGATGSVGAEAERGGVPEPASWALMIGGFFGLGGMLRRRQAAFTAVA